MAQRDTLIQSVRHLIPNNEGLSEDGEKLLEQMRSMIDIKDVEEYRVAQMAMQLNALEWWVKHGLEVDEPNCAVHWLKGERCAESFTDRTCMPPGVDHPSNWLRDGEPYAYVFHPYQLGWRPLTALTEWCNQNGLIFEVFAFSWHFPGWTSMVAVMRSDEVGQNHYKIAGLPST